MSRNRPDLYPCSICLLCGHRTDYPHAMPWEMAEAISSKHRCDAVDWNGAFSNQQEPKP
jgi:hypothetical protein